MYQNILLPVEVDGSDDYARAYELASSLLEAGGKITLLHAIEPIPTYVETYMPPDFHIKSRTEVQKDLTELSAKLGTSPTVLVFGSAGRSIVGWAKENAADCIVIKSHRPAFSDVFLGSTAAWVVRHAQTSVHVVR